MVLSRKSFYICPERLNTHKMKKQLMVYGILLFIIGCSAESQKGQAVGFVTHFTRSGVFWKSWDLELNSSQTGMTSTAQELDLSIDNDNEDTMLVNQLDSAQKYGWKVQIDYQQNWGTNCMGNRGGSSKFIKKIEILDKTPLGGIKGSNNSSNFTGKVIDTIYLMIVPNKGKIPVTPH